MDIDKILEKAVLYIDTILKPILNAIGEPLEGNIFDDGDNIDFFLLKRKNVILACQNKKKALEIGFNSGYSAVLILLSNPEIRLTCVDIGWHRYVIPCYEQIKRDFGDRIHLIIGDSRSIIPNIYDKFDLIHIDGGHTLDIAESDIVHTHNKLLNNSVIIMDDVNINDTNHQLSQLWMYYVTKFEYKEPSFQIYKNNYNDVREINLN